LRRPLEFTLCASNLLSIRSSPARKRIVQKVEAVLPSENAAVEYIRRRAAMAFSRVERAERLVAVPWAASRSEAESRPASSAS